jgi:GTPase KRas
MVDNAPCLFDITDTPGMEEYSVLRDQYIRVGQGFLLVYSATSACSFESVEKLYARMMRIREDKPFPPLILVATRLSPRMGNKRVVSSEQGLELARRFGCMYMEVDADLNCNVREVFFQLVRMINQWRHVYGFPNSPRTSKKKRRVNCMLQ